LNFAPHVVAIAQPFQFSGEFKLITDENEKGLSDPPEFKFGKEFEIQKFDFTSDFAFK
jgi:hypothetical protein